MNASPPVFQPVPIQLTPEMMRAVRDDPATRAENWEEWHTRLGWLVCAWEVLLKAAPMPEPEPEPSPVPDWLREREQLLLSALLMIADWDNHGREVSASYDEVCGAGAWARLIEGGR